MILFQHFLLCSTILPHLSKSLPTETKQSSSTDIQEKINLELFVFTKLLNKISDPGIRDQFKSHLEELALKVIRAKDEANTLLIQKIILSQEKELYKESVMWLSCGKSLRYRMDIFGTDLGLRGGTMSYSAALSGTLTNIKTKLKKRSSTLHEGVSILAQRCKDHYSTHFPRGNDRIKKWIGQVKKACELLKSIPITLKQSNTVTPKSLSDLIIEIQATPNEEEAVELFKEQCQRCDWLNRNFDHLKEGDEIRKLATCLSEQEKEELISSYSNENSLTLGVKERIYVQDLLDKSSYFITNSKRYADCAQVLYFAPSSRIDLLKKDLDNRWPGIEFGSKVNKFCDAFVSLYDLVSATDMHAPPKDLTIKCKPDDAYFYEYLKSLGSTHYSLDEFIFVCKILGQISMNLTNFATSKV